MDKFTKAQRSFCMSKIRGKNTSPERKFKAALRALDIKFTSHPKLSGKPDVKIHFEKTVIFIDGCYWHGCPIHYRESKSNKKFWRNKIQTNKSRDKKVNLILRSKGYKVMRIWEHEINNSNSLKSWLRLNFVAYEDAS